MYAFQRMMVVVQEPRENEIKGVMPSYQVSPANCAAITCPHQVGDPVNVTCYSRGSSPPAELQWVVNGERGKCFHTITIVTDLVRFMTRLVFTTGGTRSSLTPGPSPRRVRAARRRASCLAPSEPGKSRTTAPVW